MTRAENTQIGRSDNWLTVNQVMEAVDGRWYLEKAFTADEEEYAESIISLELRMKNQASGKIT